MRIKRIAVKNLFREFNYDFTLEEEGRVTIIFGLNGTGKTTVLRMLDALFHERDEYLATLDFDEMRMTLENDDVIRIRREGVAPVVEIDTKIHTEHVPKRAAIMVYERYSGEENINHNVVSVPRPRWDEERIEAVLTELAPGTQRVGPDRWRLAITNQSLKTGEIIAQFALWDLTVPDKWSADVPWLRELFPYGSALFLATNRLAVSGLTGAMAQDIQTYYGEAERSEALNTELTVERESQHIKLKIKEARDHYRKVAEKLDASFPQRVLDRVTIDDTIPPKLASLMKQLEGVKQRQEKLLQWGLLEQSTENIAGDFSDALQNVTLLKMLEIYVEDATQKLETVASLESSIALFLEVMQKKLERQNKSISVTAEKGIRVTKQDGYNLVPAQLSSGEQHLLAMMCALLFHTSPNTLVLVDEPETSLHIAWQKEYIADMERLANVTGFYALIASHSPDIEQGRADITRSFDIDVVAEEIEDILKSDVEETDV